MQIFIASDHAGFEMKKMLIAFIRDELGHQIEDMGAEVYDEGDDYPDFISKVATCVSQAQGTDVAYGIILGGSGQGEAIVANRFKGVRAAVYYGGNVDILTLSREHNDANVLSLGARFITEEVAKEAVKVWLSTGFSGDERHVRRIQKIDTI